MDNLEMLSSSLRNIRTVINAGNNKRGTYLPGKWCKYAVEWLDKARGYIWEEQLRLQKEKEETDSDA